MSDAPRTRAMAALRQLRKAAHGHSDLDEMSRAVDALEEPMDDLCRAWQQVCGVLIDHDSRAMTAERWATLVSALSVLDVALGSFFGPSGWEPQASTRRPDAVPPPDLPERGRSGGGVAAPR